MDVQEPARVKPSGRTWYVAIPARLRRKLSEAGVRERSVAVWRRLEDLGDRVALVLEIYKGGDDEQD